jgi:hypothetical protein
MKILIDKSFVKDVDKIKDIKAASNTTQKLITELEKSEFTGTSKCKKN